MNAITPSQQHWVNLIGNDVADENAIITLSTMDNNSTERGMARLMSRTNTIENHPSIAAAFYQQTENDLVVRPEFCDETGNPIFTSPQQYVQSAMAHIFTRVISWARTLGTEEKLKYGFTPFEDPTTGEPLFTLNRLAPRFSEDGQIDRTGNNVDVANISRRITTQHKYPYLLNEILVTGIAGDPTVHSLFLSLEYFNLNDFNTQRIRTVEVNGAEVISKTFASHVGFTLYQVPRAVATSLRRIEGLSNSPFEGQPDDLFHFTIGVPNAKAIGQITRRPLQVPKTSAPANTPAKTGMFS